MIVVSDTGPLIALAKADRLYILERLFGQVKIPPAVYRELLAGRWKQAGLIPAVCPLLEEIRQRGYWLSEALLETAARLAKEER